MASPPTQNQQIISDDHHSTHRTYKTNSFAFNKQPEPICETCIAAQHYLSTCMRHKNNFLIITDHISQFLKFVHWYQSCWAALLKHVSSGHIFRFESNDWLSISHSYSLFTIIIIMSATSSCQFTLTVYIIKRYSSFIEGNATKPYF